MRPTVESLLFFYCYLRLLLKIFDLLPTISIARQRLFSAARLSN